MIYKIISPMFHFQFFTIWSLTLYVIFILLFNIYKIPLYITYFIISLIITIGIYGNLLMQLNKKRIIKKYPFIKNYINIIDILLHIIPLIHILHYKKYYISNSLQINNSYISRILIILLISIYISIYNIENVYFSVNKYILIIPSFLIYNFYLYTLNIK